MKNLRKQWVFILWVLIFTLVLVIGLFGHLIPIPRFRNRQFWHYWEVAALGASVLYNGLFYILGFFFPPQMFLRLNPQKNIGYVILLMGVALGFLVGATAISLTEGKCSYQLLCILIVTLSFGVIDLIMGRTSTNNKIKDDFSATLFLSEIPAFIAFLVLFIYSLIYNGPETTNPNETYSPEFRAFVGGAIAFQMIASNWVLASIFRKPGDWYQDAIDGSDGSV